MPHAKTVTEHGCSSGASRPANPISATWAFQRLLREGVYGCADVQEDNILAHLRDFAKAGSWQQARRSIEPKNRAS